VDEWTLGLSVAGAHPRKAREGIIAKVTGAPPGEEE